MDISQLHIIADKRLRYASPKPIPLSRKQGLKCRNILISNFNGLKEKSKCIEGWASFIRRTLVAILPITRSFIKSVVKLTYEN
ncbi:MAG: hypothetical protein XD76_0008 [candidate division TA06 bacterium 32_111]|uniref:Uncharacterized protein n=2 Tax=Bacteria candidate phyla TaxID=1783234 RepID=A0A101I3B0_UNCT6|nr:MAG: hypothetical protein XD76_0008 [candidate division TA06 bacterium 32_111]KUK88176.1 MAG: hypothetical protein XE03_0182 [candidate division TA06 bacterium 34_109]HAF07106.1 hypothetical protein [candidate division WOR-3 bacterium]HCP17147.1 hypothetical protein [candidate division WOR-3 bacterium]